MRPGRAETVVAAVLAGGAATDAAAQCALCGQAAPYAGTSPERTALAFVLATLALLVPAVAAASLIGRSLWRSRDLEPSDS